MPGTVSYALLSKDRWLDMNDPLGRRHRMTPEEIELIEQRQRELPELLRDEAECLVRILAEMQVEEPEFAIQRAWAWLEVFVQWVSQHRIDDSNWAKIAARSGFFLGTCLSQRYGFVWVVMKEVDHPAFGRYVLISPTSRGGKSIAIDVYGIGFDLTRSAEPAQFLRSEVNRLFAEVDAFTAAQEN
jgi:hypothetical protein